MSKMVRSLIRVRGSVNHDRKAGTGLPVITERHTPQADAVAVTAEPSVLFRPLMINGGRDAGCQPVMSAVSAALVAWCCGAHRLAVLVLR